MISSDDRVRRRLIARINRRPTRRGLIRANLLAAVIIATVIVAATWGMLPGCSA